MVVYDEEARGPDEPIGQSQISISPEVIQAGGGWWDLEPIQGGPRLDPGQV